jgi:predicted short-subunit dehydrogenase-like oxidoreductase (DUF2520 family)
MKVVLLGSGNVATHIGKAIHNSPHTLLQVYNKSMENGKKLAQEFYCDYIQDIKDLSTAADLYIISIRDDALEDFIEQMPVVKGIVVHTAGSKPINILQKFPSYGIFYPLQTFSKQRSLNFRKIPVCLEADSDNSLSTLHKFAKDLSNNIEFVDSEKRLTLHIAAVIVCNFPNFLFTMADDFLNKHDLSFEILKPLIGETVDKAMERPPETFQTGPARRGDKKTIEKHLKFLSENEKLGNLYRFVSNMIDEYYNHPDNS